MHVNRWMTVAVMGIVLVAGGCKRQQPVATITQVPEAPGPSPEDAQQENLEKSLAELYNLPELGTGAVLKTPDDELWNRYPSGILTHDVRPSNGAVPKLGQTVSIVYTGTFPGNNKEFDKNSTSNPLVFRLGSKSIIKGLSMGISTMHLGSRRRIFVPSELAYGELGQPGKIPGNQALIFEVELLAVKGEAVAFPKDAIPTVEPLGPMLPSADAAGDAATKPK